MYSAESVYPWPRLVFWETTAACNLACSHCRRTTVATTSSPDDLTTAEAERLIEQIAARGGSVLVFSGGEPLLRKDLFGLAEYAVKRGLIVALASNGTLLDGDVARALKGCGVSRVSISLDGVERAGHDAFRRQEGAFDAALLGIEALREAGVPIQINVTVAKHNVSHLDEFVALAKRLDAVALHFFLLVPVGCGMEIAEEQTICAETYEETLAWIYETECREPSLQLKATCAPHYFRVVRQRQATLGPGAGSALPPSAERHEVVGGHAGAGGSEASADALRATTRGCLAGTGICFVSHTGKVQGCGYLPVEAGDLRRQSFADIWENSELFAQMRDINALKGKCGRCGFKTVCGGCRARAYGVTGDYLAEEPLCSFEPPRASGVSPG